jgi:hypothetical protein
MSHRESLFVSGESDDEMDGFRKTKSSSELPNAKLPSINRSVLSTKSSSPSVASGTSQQLAVPTTTISPFGKPSPFSSFKSDSTTFGKPSVDGPFAISPSSFGKPSSASILHTPFLSAASDPIPNNEAKDPAFIVPTNTEAASKASTFFPKPDASESSSRPLTKNAHSIFQFQSQSNSDGLAESKKVTQPASPFSFSSGAPPSFGSTATSLYNFPKPSPGTSSTVNNTTSSPDNRPEHTYNQPIASASAAFEDRKAVQATLTPTTQSSSVLDSQQEPQRHTSSLFQFPAAQSNPSASLKNERSSSTKHSPPPKQQFTFIETTTSQKQNLSTSTLPFAPSSPRPSPSVFTSEDTTGLPAHQTANSNFNTSTPLVQISQHPVPELAPSSNDNPTFSYAPNCLRPSTVSGKSSPTGLFASSDPFSLRNTNPHEARPAALHALSESLMLDDDGLLQQFIEYTIGPIVTASIRQVQEERSWQQARQSLLISCSPTSY